MTRNIFLLCLLLTASQTTYAQNLNTTFRSKITFPGQTLANVWGYTARSGHEYALAGASLGLVIVDITDPDHPQQIVQIPGPNNLWKEIKTYSHYAYVTSEGGSGIHVVDLANLPSPNLDNYFYQGDGPIAGQLTQIHALQIDVQKGFLYAWGGNLFGGGAKVFDLKPDPYHPHYVGKFDQLGYVHDGYVGNDTMFAGLIYAGEFAMVDMHDKSAPQILATQNTPGAFTHNTWLTDDHKTLLTTDEVSNSFLSAFDVSDPDNIRLLDKIQSNPGSQSIVHNTYALKHWAVTSWYKDGFTIVDISRPDNLVQVGNYDTYPGTGSGFEGCWGVYPYFPSGNIIASNIEAQNTSDGELFIVTPQYHRACFLEGSVKDLVTGNPINNAKIEVLGTNYQEFTNANGIFKTGQPESGYFTIRISKSGYQNYEILAKMAEGEVVTINARLSPNANLKVTGLVVEQGTMQPVSGASVWLAGGQDYKTTTSDINGAFTFTQVDPGVYNIGASDDIASSGILHGVLILDTTQVVIQLSQNKLRPGYAGNAEYSLQNPFIGYTTLHLQHTSEDTRVWVVNTNGQMLESYTLDAATGSLDIGQNLPAGFYHLFIKNGSGELQTIKLIKIQ